MRAPYSSFLPRAARRPGGVRYKSRGTAPEGRDDVPLLTRLTAHLGIMALVIGGLLWSGLGIGPASSDFDSSADSEGELPPIQFEEDPQSGNLRIIAIPFTNVSKLASAPQPVRAQVVQYIVQPDDTVTGIATRFHISPESILWANAKLQDNPDLLSIGQKLSIPPTSGVLHTVQAGDTVAAIAARFKAEIADILNDPLNQGLHDFKSNPPKLAIGQFLMVPNGQKAIPVRQVFGPGKSPASAFKGTGIVGWPTSGCVYQGYWLAHRALDIDNVAGTRVIAADSGYVAIAAGGWNFGYGKMVLIDHGNGYLTRYGHLSVINVMAGQSVKKGAMLGRMGSTGNSTGPHLHFEVIKNGVLVNPLFYASGRAPGRCAGR